MAVVTIAVRCHRLEAILFLSCETTRRCRVGRERPCFSSQTAATHRGLPHASLVSLFTSMRTGTDLAAEILDSRHNAIAGSAD